MSDVFYLAVMQNSPFALVLAFVGGVLASLTPCIYPVLPITVSFFAGRARTHRETIWLSFLYVLGMAVVYTIIGIAAALTGKVFGTVTMTSWVFALVGGLMILFGLMQLGVIRLTLPSFNIATQNKNAGALVMGMTSGVIVAPCTVPILGAILTMIAAGQSLVFGAVVMFSFSLGLGLLLLILGVFTGAITRLPKSGDWLVWLEKGTGVLFLGIGAYFLLKIVL